MTAELKAEMQKMYDGEHHICNCGNAAKRIASDDSMSLYWICEDCRRRCDYAFDDATQTYKN